MLTCYLDSQDYSGLTDPKQDTLERRKIKDALLHLARSKQVRFAFSGTAVCEAVALTADAAHLAELKADFLSELCGSNAMVSVDRLVHEEIKALAGRCTPPKEMFDPQGRWFPEISIDEKLEQPWNLMRELAEEEMKAMGLSRQERRAKARKLVKNGKPRQMLTSQLAMQDPKVLSTEFLKKYPMHPDYSEVMARYALGQATSKDFNEALMNSLADPRWMMKWFANQHEVSNPIAEMVRRPGRELGQAMRSLVEASIRWATVIQTNCPDADPIGKRGEITLRWQEMEDRLLMAFTQRLATSIGIELGEFEARHIDTHCPGISAGIRSMYSSVWANVGEGRKEEISNSQPVDALHAFYAPYVRVFRADRFMAPHIQKQVRRAETIVVPRLSLLVDTLEKYLR